MTSAFKESGARSIARQSAQAWGYAVIFAATLLAYVPALRAGFIWDDDGHVTRPALRSLHGLFQIWFQLGATQQYYPVLHSAFWLEHLAWGDAPLGYHLLNIVLHGMAACLFVRLLRFLAVPGAWIAGLLFALHPVEVESVAWISEQKNTLSIVFYLLSALAYFRFDERRSGRSYASASILFLLALGSKTVTATLPAALLVVLWWKNGRLSWRRDVMPLAPWILAGLGAGLFTAWVEHTYIGARGATFGLSILARMLLAGRVALFYLGKLIWPGNLMFIYPRWMIDPGAVWQWLFPVGVIVVLVAAYSVRRRNRAPLAVLLLFLGALVPALGFVNVYPFVFSYVADHFQYQAGLAVLALAGGLAARLISLRREWGIALVGVLGIFLGCLTWSQAGLYRDAETLYTTLLQKNPQAWLADDNLGVILASRGQLAEAIAHYENAERLNPNFPQTYNNLGNAMARQGRWPDAFGDYSKAVALWPDFIEAENNWGRALLDAGRYPDAEVRFQESLRARRENPEAEYGLGSALANEGRLDVAMEHFRAALKLRPDYPEALANLGLALVMTGKPAEAHPYLVRAISLRPSYAEAHAYLGLAFAHQGQWSDAIHEYGRALEINPRDQDVRYQLDQAQAHRGSEP